MDVVDGETEAEERVARRSVGRPRTLDAAQHSLTEVLTLVRSGRATTRTEIERFAEMSRAVAADRLAALVGLGLVEESGRAASSGGRAARTFSLKADAGRLLVATLDRSTVSVGLADLSGDLLGEHHEGIDIGAGVQAVLDRLTSVFLWLMEEHGGRSAIWGVGLAIPGPVMSVGGRDGDIRAPDLPDDWSEIDLVSEIALRCGAPAHVRSVAQVMAMGEVKAGDGAADMLFVKLGRSVSASVVTGGRLHLGFQGAAGLLGHVRAPGAGDRLCRCGNRGCLETVVGSEAIARDGRLAARDGRSDYLAAVEASGREVDATDVAHGAQLGDAYCAEAIARCGRILGEALGPFANMLNPAQIVLSGGPVQSGDILLAAIREAVYRASHPLVTRDLRIVPSRMGGSSGLVGAAQVVSDELFAPDCLESWITLGTPRELPVVRARAERARARERAREARHGPRAPAPPTHPERELRK